MNIISQFFGIIALLFICISIMSKKRGYLLKWQILATIFFSLQYLMLDAYDGLSITIIGLARSIIFYLYHKNNKIISINIFVSLIAGFLLVGIYSYSNYISLIPIFISLIYTYGVWQEQVRKFRIISSICAVFWMVYNLMVGAYVAIISNIIELLVSVLSLKSRDKFY